MSLFELPEDTKAAAQIRARQAREAERRERILDDKRRTMGLDVDSLKSQEQERKDRERRERDEHEAAVQEALRQEQVILLLEQRKQEDLRKLRLEQNEFRAKNQTKESRATWDLNDPNALRNGGPIRGGDDDERLGPSSLQKFEGEDLKRGDTVRDQKSKQREWAQQQMAARQEQQAEVDAATRLEHLRLLEQTRAAEEIDQSMRRARTNAKHDATQRNLEEAERRRQEADERRRKEEEDNMKHMLATVHGTLLSEDPKQAVPANPGRMKILPDRYKGMTPDEIKAIRDEQSKQAQYNATRRRESKQEEEEVDKGMHAVNKQVHLMERAQDRARKEMLMKTAQENSQLASTQRTKRGVEVVAKNEVSEDFFSQFGTSSR